jgi:hypothetical protein
MKKFTNLLGAAILASMAFSACGTSGPSACDCAETTMELFAVAMAGELSEEEIDAKYTPKLEVCEALSQDETFAQEVLACMEEMMDLE